jgi:hypothetical protein
MKRGGEGLPEPLRKRAGGICVDQHSDESRPQKRVVREHIAEHLNTLAAEVERAMAAANEKASAYQTDPGRGVHQRKEMMVFNRIKKVPWHGPDSRR